MSILSELKARFRGPLTDLVDDPSGPLEMIRRSQDPKFGDYQANFPMALGKRLGRPPRDVATEIAKRLDLTGFCDPAEVAGPGFINLRVQNDWLSGQLFRAVADDRLGIATSDDPRAYVIDYSAPNVAKPMHVGHIRSTVIGDALARTLRFLVHNVVTDNHLGDWGTQFGMIIHGYRNFVDEKAYRKAPVKELARLYRLVRQLMDYREGKRRLLLGGLEKGIAEQEANLQAQREAAGVTRGKKPHKKTAKALKRLENDLQQAGAELAALKEKLAVVEDDPALLKLADKHPDIESAVLGETAKLHAGDPRNLELWQEFLPACQKDIEQIYKRLDIQFDHTLGESFYNDRLPAIVKELRDKGVAEPSDGAICVFLEGHDVPMLIRKKDGAFLYATTDLATIRYRMETWKPDAVLYVVDHRQSLHFDQLFAVTRLMGYKDVELQHVTFGTVLGGDGRPFKTRSGDTVGLEGLLNKAVLRAGAIVCDNDDAKPKGPELSPKQRAEVAETVGIAALKYADLSQNRTSDYVFSYDKMLAMTGNTATYMQYAYARVRSIFARGNVDVDALRVSAARITLDAPAERALAIELLRFSEALELVLADYRPNQLTSYLFELANRYSTFFEQCPVLKAETAQLRQSRLLLCDLTARTIQKGLQLLGIKVVEKM